MYQHTIYCDTMSEKPTQEVYLVCKQRLPCCLSVSPPYADVGRISARRWIENQVQNIPEQKPTLSKVEFIRQFQFSIPCHSFSFEELSAKLLPVPHILSTMFWAKYHVAELDTGIYQLNAVLHQGYIEAAVEYSVWFVSNLIRATRYWGSISSYTVRL